MRVINQKEITAKIKKAVIDANHFLPYDVISAIKKAANKEKNKLAKTCLYKIIENAKKAKKGIFPLCQDTGLVVVFIEQGDNVKINGDIYAAINEGIKEGYSEGFLRKSTADPLTRQNLNTNTPAIIHYDIAKGSLLKISLLIKGAGSENKSAVKMLTPADGKEGIIEFVIDTVKKAGASACPPYIIGVGIGGNLEIAPYLAKKALLRKINDTNRDRELSLLEKVLLKKINSLKIGAFGFGGDTTALAVKIEMQPCHIASLPVAVNIQCHSARHKVINI